VLLRAHHRGRHSAFLRGEGALTLVTDPPGAEVRLERYEERDRRLQPVDLGVIGRTPLRALPLSRGSYRLRVRAPGTAEVLYPVRIERDGHWDGLARQRIWVEGFVIGRHPVTNGDYLRFLDDLARRGREAEAQMACPCREMGFVQSGERHPMFARDAQGLFKLPSPDEDPSWGPDVPVVQIDWLAAMAYAAWLAEARGKPFRLPNELEREKAARGVDGRRFAWGDQGDATFACVLEGHRDTPAREAISGHPSDESPYGVRGLTGNVRDWCINVWKSDGPRLVGGRLDIDAAALDDADFRAIRGGFWGAPLGNARSASRYGSRPSVCRYSVGVRVLRSFPGR
jgi:formylglycine-generating enzyme required for sulfatase activity